MSIPLWSRVTLHLMVTPCGAGSITNFSKLSNTISGDGDLSWSRGTNTIWLKPLVQLRWDNVYSHDINLRKCSILWVNWRTLTHLFLLPFALFLLRFFLFFRLRVITLFCLSWIIQALSCYLLVTNSEQWKVASSLTFLLRLLVLVFVFVFVLVPRCLEHRRRASGRFLLGFARLSLFFTIIAVRLGSCSRNRCRVLKCNS